MKAAGVVVEYNPFHNGHAYHLQKTKKLTEADITIAVMSGPFLQRGEPALISKWSRTMMALQGGVDIVVELPYLFAVQHAQTFASGAVAILDALGVSALCFGSEDGRIEQFEQLVELQRQHKERFDAAVRTSLFQGQSYPAAVANACSLLQGEQLLLDMTKPNNILGFHYVQAIQAQKSSIRPFTVTRLHAQYHDEAFASASIASATSIRKHMLTHGLDGLAGVIPRTTFSQLQHYDTSYNLWHHWEQYFPVLKYKLLTMSPMQLQEICGIEEGIEHRLLRTIKTATSFPSFMGEVKTKRYTWTRLQRILVHVLTHTTKEDVQEAKPAYIRLLGMSSKGQRYISAHKKQLSLPLVSNVKTFSHPMLTLDMKASYVYYSVLREPLQTTVLKQDFAQHPIRYNEETGQLSI